MRIKKQLACLIAFVCLATTTLAGNGHGTDILHLFVREGMTEGAVPSEASGRVDANQNEQGNAAHQKLDISLRDLDPEWTYKLFVIKGTNYAELESFIVDSRGTANLRYQVNGNGNLGKGKKALPADLNPVSEIETLAILPGSLVGDPGFSSTVINVVPITSGMILAQSILVADLTSPDKLQYLVQRDLGTNDIQAALRIKATADKTQFRLTASGLNATADYFLLLNSQIVQTNTTDARGRLSVSSVPEVPANILDLHSVTLWDSVSNVVLSTELP